ncbi:G2/M phase-specific E3 ubiquitin-protein ligase-like [Siphateles boraxobius]
MYKLVGQMIAVCLVHGGVEPHFFSQRLLCQVCNLQPPVPDIQQIVDYDFREKMIKIQSAHNVNDAQCAIMEASDQLAMLGSLRHIQTLEERDDLVESATKFFLDNRLRDSLDQFKEGLKCLGLLPLMQKHPELFKELFMNEEKPLLARDISALFKAELSPVGSNRRVLESRTICFWRDWLIEVEDVHGTLLNIRKVDSSHRVTYSVANMNESTNKRELHTHSPWRRFLDSCQDPLLFQG